MTESVTFSVQLPPACLSPNNRAHWRTKAAAKQEYAEVVWIAGSAVTEWQRGRVGRAKPKEPWEYAAVHLVWFSTHQKDCDNIIAHAKSLIDGLSTKGQRPLGLFIDDRDITITAEWRRESRRANGRVEVTVERRNP